MSFTQRFSEGWQLLDTIYGVNVAAGNEANTGSLLLENMHRVVVIIHPVKLNDALDVDVEQQATSGGTPKTVDSNSKDITVATTDTKPSVIEIRCEELDVTGGYEYLNVEVTTAGTGGNANYYVVEVWGYPRYLPADTTLLDSVTD